MGERPSEYDRDKNDWYIEPAWCVSALREHCELSGLIHDPCCGIGTIPKMLGATGADITDRGFGYEVQDFLQENRMFDNIVTNPPYNIAQAIIEHALIQTTRRVAALVQLKFLSSQKRYSLFCRPETEKVIMFSRRPSMPPGEMLMKHGENIRGGGSIDFCWIVWSHKHKGDATISWAI